MVVGHEGNDDPKGVTLMGWKCLEEVVGVVKGS
jgi:hypothetical protein